MEEQTMSRIGKLPVNIPAGVDITLEDGNKLTVKGPKGTLVRKLSEDMNIAVDAGVVTVERPSDLKKFKALHGLTRTLINNMVIGVTQGYSKTLEMDGVGYRAAKSGSKLTMTLGYSHPVEMTDPDGVTSTVEGQNKIVVSGIDKEKVGQYAAEIRSKRLPEPYLGHGIKYSTEKIRRKAGKTGKK
jgi:large subunit ribosomal protein L6